MQKRFAPSIVVAGALTCALERDEEAHMASLPAATAQQLHSYIFCFTSLASSFTSDPPALMSLPIPETVLQPVKVTKPNSAKPANIRFVMFALRLIAFNSRTIPALPPSQIRSQEP
jgi:hypothetical protein